MPFSPLQIRSSSSDEYPFNNLIGRLLQSYGQAQQARYLQPNLQAALEKAKLYNQYYGRDKESEIGLRGAQAGHLGALTQGQNITNQYLPEKLANENAASAFKRDNPLLNSTGTAGQLGALLYLQAHPELLKRNNPEQQTNNIPTEQGFNQGQSYFPSAGFGQSNEGGVNQGIQGIDPQQLLLQSIQKSINPTKKSYAPTNLGKELSEKADVDSGYYPGTDRTQKFETPEIQRTYQERYLEKGGNLGKGEHFIYDPDTKEKIGIERPYKESERKEEEGRAFFNTVFPIISKGAAEFQGKGSIDRYNKYTKLYGRDPVATQKIDDLLLNEKLLSSGVVKEQATLGAGRTNQSYNRLVEGFSKADIPKLIRQWKEGFVLPGSAFLKSALRAQEVINQATKAASTSVPALKKTYFNPSKHKESNNSENKNDRPTPEEARAILARRRAKKS